MDIAQLLTFAVDNNADQVLVSAGSPPILRKGGSLVFTKMDALSREDTHSLIYSCLSPGQASQLETEHDLSFSMVVREGVRCHASACFERGSLAAVFTVAAPVIDSPTKLGLPSFLAEATRANHGLIVIAAPGGHGKSTAISSLVEIVNTEREATILTIEERIINLHSNKKSVIHQREVGRDTQSFYSALEAASMQDPDVLAIDPMDTPETIRGAPDYAGRGHLVIASMRADYIVEAVQKLLSAASGKDAESVRRQMSAELVALAAIRLLPRKDGEGRVPSTELLKVDAEIAVLIRNGNIDGLAARMSASEGAGIWTMDSFILKLHERGLVEDETAKRYLRDPGVME